MKKQIVLRLLLVVATYPLVIPVWIFWHLTVSIVGLCCCLVIYAFDGCWVFGDALGDMYWSPIPNGLLYDLKHWGDA